MASVTAQTTIQDSTRMQDSVDIKDEMAMSHINYIQYSLNKIRYSRSKASINAELDAVLNTINPASLKYDALIEAYQELTQSTLMGLKLNIEQEENLRAEIHNKRKNAIFNAFEGLATGAAVTTTFPNPASIGMLALQVGFNYARAQGEITADSLKQANKLDAEAIRIIDVERTGIFLSAAKVFKDKDYENTHFINETMMQSLSKITYELDSIGKLDSTALKKDGKGNLKNIHLVAKKAITYLSEKDVHALFEYFLPYHLTLLKAHYFLTEVDSNHYKEMDRIFKEIKEKSNSVYSRFYQKNEYLKDAAQYMILAEMQRNPRPRDTSKSFSVDTSKMVKYIEYMDNNIQMTLENKINHKFFLVSVYDYLGMKNEKIECLNYIRDVGAEKEMGTSWIRKFNEACADSNSNKCKEVKKDKNAYDRWERYKSEARKKYNAIRIGTYKDKVWWHISSPVPLMELGVLCKADSPKYSSEAEKCNKSMKKYEKFEKNGFFNYYFPNYKPGEGVSIEFEFFIGSLEGWLSYNKIEASLSGKQKRPEPTIME